jgi:elongation factor 1-beta
MKALEDSVRSVQMEGLVWGASKLVPIGYGIRKLQITLVVGSSVARFAAHFSSF